jgi:hypothetical protein
MNHRLLVSAISFAFAVSNSVYPLPLIQLYLVFNEISTVTIRLPIFKQTFVSAAIIVELDALALLFIVMEITLVGQFSIWSVLGSLTFYPVIAEKPFESFFI